MESEFFKELKITSSSTDYQSIQLNNASCSHLKDKCEGYKANSNQVLKECCVFLNRLDDSIIDAYLNKFEMKYNNGASDYMLGEDIIDEPTGGGKLNFLKFIFKLKTITQDRKNIFLKKILNTICKYSQ